MHMHVNKGAQFPSIKRGGRQPAGLAEATYPFWGMKPLRASADVRLSGFCRDLPGARDNAARMYFKRAALGCQGGLAPVRERDGVAARTRGPTGHVRMFSRDAPHHPGAPRPPYSAAWRTWRAVGVRIVTSSSEAVGCSATVASKSALVAFILTAIATAWVISAAASPTM
ncbi:hypothetical protein ACVW1C_000893 [Bradyrhizobium sp. USDA 4011]